MHFKSGWKSFGLEPYRACDTTYCLYSHESLPPLVFAGQSEEVGQDALQAETADFQYWYNEGIDHKMRGDHKKAAEAFQKAAEQASAMAEAWHSLGFSLLVLGQTEQGIQALSMAVKEYSRCLECYPYKWV